MKRILCAALLLCLWLAGCTAGEKDAPPDVTEAPAPQTLAVVQDGQTDFCLVCSEDAPDSIKRALPKLNAKIREKTSAAPQIDTDWTPRGEETDNSRREILIGATNRDASRALLEALPPHSYGIRVTEDKIVLAGTSDSLTMLAMYAFEDAILNGAEGYAADGALTLPVGLEIIRTDPAWDEFSSLVAGSYPLEGVLSDPVEIEWPAGCAAAQGAATDGTYFYTAFIRYTDSEKKHSSGVIVKTRIADGETVGTSEELPLDHANGMCYNPDDGVLITCNMDQNILTVIDPETLGMIEQKDGARLGFGGCYAIAYDPAHELYVTKGGGKFMYLDRSFRQVSAVTPKLYTNTEYTAQGMDADDARIYSILSPGTKTKDNIIMVHKRNGEYEFSISIPTGVEGEAIFHDTEGQYYFSCNNWSSRRAYIYKLTLSIVYK